MDWLKSIAPTIATALGGPLAGLAVNAVSSALGIDPDKVQETIQSGKLSADQIASIQQAELGLKARAQELGLDFAKLAVDAVLRLRGSTNLDHIQVIKKVGGRLIDSYLDEGFILDKRPNPLGPVRLSPVKILLANTSMDTDKVKIFGSRIF
jgi:T-complex protein 1 subunit beta